MKTRVLNCISCGKEVKELHFGHDNITPLHQSMWDDAVVDKMVAGYGSRHDMDSFVVCVCDDCIEKANHYPKQPFQLGDHVNWNNDGVMYHGFKVVGIREKELELHGDWSGSTHGSYGNCWVDIDTVYHKGYETLDKIGI